MPVLIREGLEIEADIDDCKTTKFLFFCVKIPYLVWEQYYGGHENIIAYSLFESCLPLSMNETCTASILQETMDVYDTNNDGKVTLEEYLGMLRKKLASNGDDFSEYQVSFDHGSLM